MEWNHLMIGNVPSFLHLFSLIGMGQAKRIVATGGASSNRSILQAGICGAWGRCCCCYDSV